MRKLMFTGFIFAFANNAVTAQNDTATTLLDEVIITSQRKPQKAFDIPYNIQSVTKFNIENYRPRTTPEALMGVNGVFIQKTNHGGGSPFLRGLTGNQTLILVDGIRMNNSTFRYGPNQYLNTIDAFTISKIEVAKGTGSVQYGSDAIGGVLQIFTNEADFSIDKPEWAGKAVGKYMTGDMEKTIRGEGSYSSKKVSTIMGATYRNFGDLRGGDTTGNQSPSGYTEFAFDGKMKLLLHPKIQLTLAHQLLQQHHVPVYHKVVLENFSLNEFDLQQRMLNYAKLNFKNNCLWIHNIEMIASWQQSIEGRISRKNNSNILRKERDQINTLGFTTDISSRFSHIWTANSGIEFYTDNVKSARQDVNTQNAVKSNLRGLYPQNSKYNNYSLYSLHHFTFKKWLIESGLRFNAFQYLLLIPL
ncbi:MAG: TonB-dependent receptor plug domain-containing protein [Chitinophagaceae bacterium]